MSTRIAVVDGFSTGRFLVEELVTRGAECVHVRSTPEAHHYEGTFRPADYLLDLGHHDDPPAVAHRLTQLGVTQVVPGSESGVGLADALAALIGSPANLPELSEARRSKYRMSDALRAAGLDAPASVEVTDATQAVAWFTATGLSSVVVKPVDSAGSDRVRVCSAPEAVANAVRAIIGTPNRLGRVDRTAVVQEFLAGPEYYVNTLSENGRHRVVETWRYTKTRTSAGAPIFDYEEPAAAHDPELPRIHQYALAALTALGIRTGAAHSEIVVTRRGPVLIDPGARLGGGVLPWVTAKFTGHSHAGLYADTLLAPDALDRLFGPSAPEPLLRWQQPVRYVSLINHEPGTVHSLAWADRIAALPSAVTLFTPLNPGERIGPTTDLRTSPGFVYLVAESQQEVADAYRTIRAWEQQGLYAS